METVTGAVTGAVSAVTTTVSHAIWGEGENPETKKDTIGKEPVSGQLGDVKSGEPYDKGNVDAGLEGSTSTSSHTGTGLPAKSTLTSSPKPTTTESTSDASAAAVLLPESEASRRETPSNFIADSNKPSTAAQTLPSLTSENKGEGLTFTKSDGSDTITGTGAGVGSGNSAVPRDMESLEEKASRVPRTTGFDTHTPEPVSGSAGTSSAAHTSNPATTAGSTTGTTATQSSGLQKETLDKFGLLEEKRIQPETASEPKVGESSTPHDHTAPALTGKPCEIKTAEHTDVKKSLEQTDSGEGDKEKKSLKEKIKEKLHRHKD
ncbi:uncharacterized protein RSE6_13562 [Rhynchosporium secalis]|uniref:Uncharacterized protein n=1 Tax=Rhynchosporium secalis TaxID=38038 RepID=A0A1E1MT60_RHYSE|nr:uncharacterized protein RSE6_13562 [Rhynchosporium secalis]